MCLLMYVCIAGRGFGGRGVAAAVPILPAICTGLAAPERGAAEAARHGRLAEWPGAPRGWNLELLA